MVKRFLLLAIACFIFALLIATPAAAQNKAVEAQARALDKKAMEEDYLSTEFDKAADKLNQAVSKCGTDKCSAQLRAQLKRDLGVVQVAGLGKKDLAVASFVDAMKTDPNVQLDPDLKTKEVEAAWEEAKKQAGGGAAATTKPEPAGSGGPPSGDFAHTPAREQLIRTPVPIYAEYTGSEQLTKVVAKYKGFGMTEWKQIELKPIEKGFGAEIPCMDVQQGDLQYYLQGFNAQNDPVATAGDRNRPYKVPVKRDKIEAEPPHLPGREAPKQCQDTGDCPPGFPGCKSGGGAETTLKSEGEECEEDSECKAGSCKNKVCGGEEEESTKFRRVWVGINAQLDFMVLPSGDDVCKLDEGNALPLNQAGYYCVTQEGNDYPTRPPQDKDGTENKRIQTGRSDKVSGGIAFGNVRFLLSLDYAITANIMAGVRLGFVANTYPGTAGSNEGKTFAPVHVEGRFTYIIGKDALAKRGARPYVFLAGGVAEWDAQVGVTVVETGVPGGKAVNAWNIQGPGFVSGGGGVRYAFSPRAALMFGAKVNFAVGGATTTPSVSPELGVQVGF